MLTKQYGKEPFDLHLYILWFLSKLWILLITGILGGIIIGGIYYLKNITFAPIQMYEMVSDSYIEYAVDEEGKEYTYFNQTTWGNMIYADEIMNPLLVDFHMTIEEIKPYIFATLLSDIRILTTTVQGSDKDLVKEINQALLSSISEFGNTQCEFDSIQPMRVPTDATLQKQDVRLQNATVLGVVVGITVAFFVLSLFFLWDDRIYLPSIFEKRYQIPILDIYEKHFSKGNDTVIIVDKNSGLENNSFVNNPFWDPKEMENLEKNKNYILLVNAKRHNSKLIEATLHVLEKKQSTVVGAVLYENYDTLQKMYYFPGSKWLKKHLK